MTSWSIFAGVVLAPVRVTLAVGYSSCGTPASGMPSGPPDQDFVVSTVTGTSTRLMVSSAVRVMIGSGSVMSRYGSRRTVLSTTPGVPVTL